MCKCGCQSYYEELSPSPVLGRYCDEIIYFIHLSKKVREYRCNVCDEVVEI